MPVVNFQLQVTNVKICKILSHFTVRSELTENQVHVYDEGTLRPEVRRRIRVDIPSVVRLLALRVMQAFYNNTPYFRCFAFQNLCLIILLMLYFIICF